MRFTPFWEQTVQQDEVLVFAESNGTISAGLAFDNSKNVTVRTRDGKTLVEGKDYALEGNRVLLLEKGLPYFKEGWLQNIGVPENIPTENARYRVEGCLLIDPKYLRGMQLLASYEHTPTNLRLLADLLDLPKTYALLKEKKHLKIALMGDSISNAANSSWEMGFEDYEHWFSPVVAYLSATYGAEIEFVNFSRSGYGTDWAISAVDEKFAGAEVDLAIVAFGMNDGTGGMSVEDFTENTALLTEKIRAYNIDTEFILVSTPVPNPESDFYKAQKDYIHGLRTLEKTGVTVLNMTEVFDFLLKRKRYCEIGGNNINHPNDFSYAFYTDAFKLLFDTLVTKKENRLHWEEGELLAQGFEEVSFSSLPKNLHGGYLLQTIHGVPAHTFCFYGVPERKEPVPAVVLVHGGGGNAFYKWVDEWVKRGYAAISIDINGTCFLGDNLQNRQKNERVLHFGAGSRDSIQENRADTKSSWTYQTAAQIAGARDFICSLDGVDEKKTALVGISWGGVASLLALGVDKKFAAAGIIYSAAFISEDLLGSEWKVFHDLDRKAFYDTYYDPASYIKGVDIPVIFNAGLNDQAFSPFSRQRTCDLLAKTPEIAVIPDLYHDNESNFQNETVFSFIDDVFFGEKRRVSLTVSRLGNGLAFSVDSPVEKAELLWTDGVGDEHNLTWESVELQVKDGKGEAEIPQGAKYALVNVYYGKLYTSSRIFTV